MIKWFLGLFKKRGKVDLSKLTRTINEIIIHCSATPPDMDIGVKEIREWHLAKKWSDIGYHYVIRRNGVVEEGRHVNIIGAHVAGRNQGSIGVCLIGGIDKEANPVPNFTPKQWKALSQVIRSMKAQLPRATVHGHNEFSNKACPSFSVQNWLQSENI